MRALVVSQDRTTVLVASVVAMLGAAMALRAEVDVWLSTGVVASAALIGAVWLTPEAVREATRIGRGHDSARGFGVGVAMAIATHAAHPVGRALVPGLDAEVDALYRSLDAAPGPIAALPILALVIAAEEVVFRGVLVERLGRAGLAPYEIVAAAVAVYALPQLLGGSFVLVGAALACGLVWTIERVRSRSLLEPFVAHLTWDVLVFVLWPLGR